MKIHQLPEFIAYCYFDAKIEQKSKFEVNMCDSVIDQLKTSDVSPRILALCWIYFQAHSQHLLGKFIKVKIISDFNIRYIGIYGY